MANGSQLRLLIPCVWFVCGLSNGLQQSTNGRPVGGVSAPAEQHHFAAGIDDDVTSQLKKVGSWELRPVASEESSGIGPHRCWTEDGAGPTFLEAEGQVRRSLWVRQDSKRQALFGGKSLKARQGFKANGHHLAPQVAELLCVLAQLRQVGASGHSPQPAQEHQEDRVPLLVRQTPGTLAVLEFDVRSRLPFDNPSYPPLLKGRNFSYTL